MNAISRNNMQTIYTVCDPRESHIDTLDYIPNMPKIEYDGFMIFRGEMREIREIHKTAKGVQIELIK